MLLYKLLLLFDNEIAKAINKPLIPDSKDGVDITIAPVCLRKVFHVITKLHLIISVLFNNKMLFCNNSHLKGLQKGPFCFVHL